MTWIYVMEETALPDGSLTPVYPLGVNVVLARVGGTVYAVSGPVPTYLGDETPPPRREAFLKNTSMLMQHIRTESIGTYKTKVESGWVLVALGRIGEGFHDGTEQS